MDWNWQQPDWPNFRYDGERLEFGERLFRDESGIIVGETRHLSRSQQDELKIELMSLESVGTAAIEGEHLDRESVRSSLRRQLGLSEKGPRPQSAEEGMAEMMVDLYGNVDTPLSRHTLLEWHRMIMRGEEHLNNLGRYRTRSEPMQVVSGPII